MPKLVRINLSDLSVEYEKIGMDHPYDLYGGRALSSKILLDELKPNCNPLGPENKLIFASGLLGGTPAPNSGRISIGGKSPITQGIKESNVGGRAPAFLSRYDIRAIILEGIAPSWKSIIVENGEIRIIDAEDQVGKNNYKLAEDLLTQYDKRSGIFSVGKAGEMRLKAASIASVDLEGYPSRHAGRGGLGAVMGSKKVKSIIILPPSHSYINYHDLAHFKEVAKKWGKNLYESKRKFSQFGTLVGISMMSTVNGLPTQNFRSGSFSNVDQISGEAVYDFIQKNHGKSGLACSPGCMIKCSNLLRDDAGNHLTSSFEYETVALNGSNLLISDIETLAKIDHICDDLGLDTIEIGNALGVYMETGKLKWGDGKNVIEILEGINHEIPDSIIIANGAKNVGIQFNISRVAEVKGQGISGYDPRTFKAMGVTYSTSPQGADHTAGAAIIGRGPFPNKDYGKLHDKARKIDVSRWLQIFTMILDSMGQCYFVGPTWDSIPLVTELLNAKFGWDLEPENLVSLGKKWLQHEIDFNLRENIAEISELPEFFKKESLEGLKNRFWDLDRKEIEKTWKTI